jgi:hypothetical protein
MKRWRTVGEDLARPWREFVQNAVELAWKRRESPCELARDVEEGLRAR